MGPKGIKKQSKGWVYIFDLSFYISTALSASACKAAGGFNWKEIWVQASPIAFINIIILISDQLSLVIIMELVQRMLTLFFYLAVNKLIASKIQNIFSLIEEHSCFINIP